MKYLILILFAILLSSCSNSSYDVILSNGAIVKAHDEFDRTLTKGDKICVWHDRNGSWDILNNGSMLDTIYLAHFPDSSTYIVEKRIGYIR